MITYADFLIQNTKNKKAGTPQYFVRAVDDANSKVFVAQNDFDVAQTVGIDWIVNAVMDGQLALINVSRISTMSYFEEKPKAKKMRYRKIVIVWRESGKPNIKSEIRVPSKYSEEKVGQQINQAVYAIQSSRAGMPTNDEIADNCYKQYGYGVNSMEEYLYLKYGYDVGRDVMPNYVIKI